MARLRLYEATIRDVFRNGEHIKGKNGMVRKYKEYEVGLFYKRDSFTGDYVITSVWKRERR